MSTLKRFSLVFSRNPAVHPNKSFLFSRVLNLLRALGIRIDKVKKARMISKQAAKIKRFTFVALLESVAFGLQELLNAIRSQSQLISGI